MDMDIDNMLSEVVNDPSLGDATVDFVDDLNARGFRIDNPQAKSTCGCGSSFSM